MNRSDLEPNQANTPLHIHVQLAVDRYLTTLDGEEPTQVYDLFLAQLEKPLLESILRYTRGNQSRTAQIRLKSWHLTHQTQSTRTFVTTNVNSQ